MKTMKASILVYWYINAYLQKNSLNYVKSAKIIN